MNVTELLPDLQKIDAYIAEFKDSSEKEIQAGIIRAQKAMGDLEWALKSLTVALGSSETCRQATLLLPH
jgi:GTP cyclohydrolase III